MIHRNYLFLFLGITSLGLIVFSPAIYAAIEPHITITMDPAQTTNPLLIKDSSNNDVFCINPDGYIECGGSHMFEFSYDSIPVISYSNEFSDLPTDTTFAHPSVLRQWHIDTGTISTVFELMNTDSLISAEMRRVSGTGSCYFVLEKYDNTLSWDTYASQLVLFTNSASFVYRDSLLTATTDNEITDIRVVVWADSAGNVCEIQNADVFLSIFDSVAYTITREK